MSAAAFSRAFSRAIVARHRPLVAQSPAGPRVHRLPEGRWQLAWTLSSRLDLSVHLQRLMQSLGVWIDGRTTVLSRSPEATVRREIERTSSTILRHIHVERDATRRTDHVRQVRDSRDVRHYRHVKDIQSVRSVSMQRIELRDRQTTDVRQLSVLARTIARRTMMERSRERLSSASSSSSSSSSSLFFASSSSSASRFDLRREIREAAGIERLRSTSLVRELRRQLEAGPSVLLRLPGTDGRRGEKGPAGEVARAAAANATTTVWKPVPASVAAPVPPRPPASAEVPRGVASLQERRLMEVVQREVKGALASTPPLSRFSREDYGRIADRVFTDLARRLAVERERRGI